MHCKPHFGFILWVLLATSLAPFLSIFKGLKTISRNHQTCQFLLLSRLSLCYRILSSWGKSCILCTVIKARMKHQSESVSSVHFSCSVVSDSLQTHEPEQAGLPVYHQLPEFTQTHVHWVIDDIQPSHPLSSPSPPALSLSQHVSFQMSQLFASGGQNIGVSVSASFLPMNIQDWSPSRWTGWISLQSKGLSRVFSKTIAQKHQFFGAQLSL